MLDKINSLYVKEKNLLKGIWTNHSKSFIRYWIFVFSLVVLSYLIMYVSLEFFGVDVKKFAKGFTESSSLKNAPIDKDSYWKGTVMLFKNNWTVCLQIVIISFIPIRFLYNLSLITSSVGLGIALGLAQKLGMNMFEGIVLGVLPHSILELSVFIVTAIYANKINKIIVGKILNLFRRDKKSFPSLWESIKETFFVFIFAITPLIFIAAFIEGYVTRFLFN